VQAIVAVTPGTPYPVVVGIPGNNGIASCGAAGGFKGGDSSFAGVIAGGGNGGGAAARVNGQDPIFTGAGGGGGTVSGGLSSFFGGNGAAGGPVFGGVGGAPGSASVFVTAPAFGAGGQGSNNCQSPSVLAQSGFVQLSW